jgi:hypothetical protein
LFILSIVVHPILRADIRKNTPKRVRTYGIHKVE